MHRFTQEPAAIQWALLVLIAGTTAIVLVASVIIWLFDGRDYPNFGEALWFALQTVTTVGFGDDVPQTDLGRVIGGIVMIVGITSIALLTALLTSALVDAAQERRHRFQLAHQEAVIRRLTVQLDETNDRIGRIEAALGVQAPVSAPATGPKPGDPGT